mgnify:FL=1
MSTKDKLKNIEQGLNIWDMIEIKIKNLILYLKGKLYRVDLKKLTKLEKEIISKFYNSNLNEYTLTYVTIPETDEIYPIVLKLIKRNILKEQTIMEKIDNYDGYGVKHKLTSRAWKKLNKKVKKNLNF